MSDSAFCPECKKLWARRERMEYLNGAGKGGVPQKLADGGCFDLVTLAKYKPSTSSAVEKLVHRMKRKCPSRAVRFVSERMSGALTLINDMPKDTARVVIAYVPRKYSAISKTGVDQAKRLAEGLSAATGYPCYRLIVRKRLFTPQQKTLDTLERAENTRKMFELSKEADKLCDGKTVIIVDDLLTTGATLGACSALLYRAGAARVVCATVAVSD
jgi:ComF family protein